METVECVVVGAGLIGLAIARELAIAGCETVILERRGAIGEETSSRNSEVIHAGLHYPAGSLKAVTCVQGRRLLYDYCESHGVPFRRCGKLIVATNERQLADLAHIHDTGRRNGVDDLVVLDKNQARTLEPEIECVAAVLSPSTGILDTHSYMLALLADAESHGAVLALRSALTAAVVANGAWDLTCDDAVDTSVRARWLINAAGLEAIELARRLEGFPRQHIPQPYLAKGSYFSLAGHAPFSHLVYPVPEPGGLGVHLTLDLAGAARFGPDVEWVDAVNYAVDPRRADRFYSAIRTYWPKLADDALQPAYAGVRPKISGPAEPARDFVVEGPEQHGVPGVVNLFGIESPGLTASLSIARIVCSMVTGGTSQ